MFYVIHSVNIFLFFLFFNDTATTEIYTLSLHDALPISRRWLSLPRSASSPPWIFGCNVFTRPSSISGERSEEHTSELQSRRDLVCRLLLEKKKEIHVPVVLVWREKV